MAMPSAKGLFHKAIVQSDSANRANTLERASRSTAAILAKLGFASSRVDELVAMPAQRLLEVAREDESLFPVVDGVSLPRHPFEPDAPGVSADVPMLIGTTADEGIYFELSDLEKEFSDESCLREALVENFAWEVFSDEKAGVYVAAYLKRHPMSSRRETYLGVCTTIMRDDAIVQAQRKAEQARVAVYVYRFAWESPAFGGRNRYCHTFDIPFVFDNLAAASQLWGPAPDQRLSALADRMGRAWAAFAHYGNPGHAGLPRWNAYTASQRATIVFNYVCETVTGESVVS